MRLPALLALSLLASLSACAEPSTAPERVNLVTRTNEVIPPQECPDWFGSDNEIPSNNFGCATVTNYGAMVENPRDLIEGMHRKYSNGATSAAAVGAYESGSVGGAASSSGGSSE